MVSITATNLSCAFAYEKSDEDNVDDATCKSSGKDMEDDGVDDGRLNQPNGMVAKL